MQKLLACAAMLLLSLSAYAGVIDGKVVGVADGDTLTVLQGREQFVIRLSDIDAPEKAQAFGQRSKESLSDLCFGRQARVEDKGLDYYGRRTIGRVWCDGVDANAQQIQRGMAWVYDQYVTDRSLYALQDGAKKDRKGLWADAAPTPPWKWRKAAKAEH